VQSMVTRLSLLHKQLTLFLLVLVYFAEFGHNAVFNLYMFLPVTFLFCLFIFISWRKQLSVSHCVFLSEESCDTARWNCYVYNKKELFHLFFIMSQQSNRPFCVNIK
jgi:hypothetical protein